MPSIVVLNTVYKNAIDNKEKTLLILKNPKFERILQKIEGIREGLSILKKKSRISVEKAYE